MNKLKYVYDIYAGYDHFIMVYRNGMFEVKRENEHTENSLVYIGKYEDCKNFMDSVYRGYQISLIT